MKVLKGLQSLVKDYDQAVELLEEAEILLEFLNLKEIAAEEFDSQLTKLQLQIEALEFKNMLSNEGDELSAVIQITAGAGGT